MWHWKLAWRCCGRITKKGREFTNSSKLDPMTSRSFFCARCAPDGYAIGLPHGCVLAEVDAVSLRRNERDRLRAGWETRVATRCTRSFFPQETPPQAHTPTTQQADCEVIVPAKRVEKRTEAEGRACSYIRLQSFFCIACCGMIKSPSNATQVFGWVLGERNPPLPFGR